MKLNREQIAFVVVLLVLAWMGWSQYSGGSTGKKAKRFGSSRGGDVRDLAEFDTAGAGLFGGDEASWRADLRNVFRAPSEYSALPPVPLAPPPRPLMPPARPVPDPGPDPFHRVDLVEVFTVPEGVELAPRDSGGLDAVFADEESAEGEEGETDAIGVGDPAAVLGRDVTEETKAPRLTASQKKVKSLQERLSNSPLDVLDRAREEETSAQDEAERERTLDKIHWAGEVWLGEVLNDARKRPGQQGYDRYQIKLRIDSIRANGDLDAARRDELLADRELEIEFRRWRKNKFERPQKYAAVNIETIEFGETPINVFELGRRRLEAGDVAGHLALVRGLVVAGEHRLAKEHLLGMMDAGRSDRAYFAALADVARRDLDYDSELLAINEGLAAFPGDADLLAARGVMQSRLGLDALATESFEAALAKDPRCTAALAGYGRHLVRRGPRTRDVPAQAASYLTKALDGRFDVDEDRHAVQAALGRARLATGDRAGARRIFEDVVRAREDHAEARLGLAATSFLAGDRAAARAGAEALLAENPLFGRAYYLVGLCDLAEGKWQDARDRLYDSFEADPFFTARAQIALGYLYERIGRAADAQAAYDAAHEADPTDPEVHLAEGRGFLLVGDHDQARTHLVRALEEMPGQFEVIALLGEVAFAQERDEEALRFTEAALGFAPESDFLNLRKAHILMRLGRFDDAKTVLDRAKTANDSIDVELGYAYYYYVRGNHDESLKRFRAALKRIPDEDAGPLAEYARRNEFEISENLAKQVWTDDFNRAGTGRDLLRGWDSYAPASGIQIALADGRARLTGKQRQSEVATSMFLSRTSKEFVSFEATLEADAGAGFTAAIALLTFRKKTGDQNTLVDKASGGLAYSGLIVGKTPEGRLAWRVVDRYELGPWQPVGDGRWPRGAEGETIPVSIGIAADQQDRGSYDILVGGAPALSGIEVKGLGQANRELQLWIFTQAEIDRRIDLGVNDVRIVTRRDGK
ncbi:MAG: tetratricopeptide repeat protein [Planctomycetota bacterium]